MTCSRGKNLSSISDGSIFLHVELVSQSKDNYIPEERLLDPLMMKTAPGASPDDNDDMDVEDGARAHVLPQQDDDKSCSHPTKCHGVQKESLTTVQVETVLDDEDDNDDIMSHATNPAATAQAAMAATAAEQDAFAEAARKKGAKVLNQVEQQETKMSSLAEAAAKGRAAASAANGQQP